MDVPENSESSYSLLMRLTQYPAVTGVNFLIRDEFLIQLPLLSQENVTEGSRGKLLRNTCNFPRTVPYNIQNASQCECPFHDYLSACCFIKSAQGTLHHLRNNCSPLVIRVRVLGSIYWNSGRSDFTEPECRRTVTAENVIPQRLSANSIELLIDIYVYAVAG